MEVVSSTTVLGYEEAASMVGQPFTCFHLESHRQHISLSPKYIGKISEGIHESLKIELNRYSKSMEGIPVAYSKPQCVQRFGSIMDESPYLHFDVEVNFVVFKPINGSLLLGKVNKLGEDHVGCLVHGIFNASIHRPHDNRQANWARKQLSGGDEFQFEVTGLQTRSGIVSLMGKMPDDSHKNKRKRSEVSVSYNVGADKSKKRKKNKLADQSFETTSTDLILKRVNLDEIDSSYTESNSKSDTPQSTMNYTQPSQNTTMDTSEQNSVLLDASGHEKKKKKKKKKDKDRDLESSTVDPLPSLDKQSNLSHNVVSSQVKNTDDISFDIESIKVKQEKDLFFTGVNSVDQQDLNSDSSSSKQKKKRKKEKQKQEAASFNKSAVNLINQDVNTSYLDSGTDITSPRIYNHVNIKKETPVSNGGGESKRHKKKSKKVKREPESP